MVTSPFESGWEAYMGSFVVFTILFALLKEKGYPIAQEYIKNKKGEVEQEISNVRSSFDFSNFTRLHSKLHEYERLKSRVDWYIICSKWSCISLVIFSIMGIATVLVSYLASLKNLITILLILFNIVFWVSTTSIPTIGELLSKFVKIK